MTRLRRETQRRVDFGEAFIDAAKRAQRACKLNQKKRIKQLIARLSHASEAAAKQIDPGVAVSPRLTARLPRTQSPTASNGRIACLEA